MSHPQEQNHEHDLVKVLSADETQARDYCRDCGFRSEWQDPPAELTPWTEAELEEIKARAAAGQPSTFGELTAEGGN